MFRLRPFDIFSQEEMFDSGGNSWCDLWDDPFGSLTVLLGLGRVCLWCLL